MASEGNQFEDRDTKPQPSDSEKIVLDREGFLRNPSLWSEAVATTMAREAGIRALSPEHWRVLHFIRKYYLEQGKEPLNHHIKSATGMSLKQVEALFPGGISRGAKRLAGLPRPKGCGAGSS